VSHLREATFCLSLPSDTQIRKTGVPANCQSSARARKEWVPRLAAGKDPSKVPMGRYSGLGWNKQARFLSSRLAWLVDLEIAELSLISHSRGEYNEFITSIRAPKSLLVPERLKDLPRVPSKVREQSPQSGITTIWLNFC